MAVAVVAAVLVATGHSVELLLLGGLVAAGLGLVAVLRGQVRWARMGRRSGGLTVAAGLIVALVGGALSTQVTPTIAAGPASAGGSGASVATTSSGAAPQTPTASAGAPPAGAVPALPRATATTQTVAGQPDPAGRAGTALVVLATLAVKGRAPKTGYDRSLFGPAWADVDRNGCDTRNDVLRRDLVSYALRTGTHGCVVSSGTLLDPYTATTIAFLRGQSTSARVQIDHVVALSDAWQKGAQQLSADARRSLANDSLNLLAVDGPSNQRKSDGDAATWLPPNKAYRCPYAARQVAVKAKYGLWVTTAEHDALARILAACPTQPLPTAGAFVLGEGAGRQAGSVAPAPQAVPKAVTPQPVTPPRSSSTDPRFDTCKAAKAAGYGPYRRGLDAEYDWYRDGDSDGTTCE